MSRLIFTLFIVLSFFLSFFMDPIASLAVHSQDAVIYQISGSLKGGSSDYKTTHNLPEFQENGLLYVTLTAGASTYALNKFIIKERGAKLLK